MNKKILIWGGGAIGGTLAAYLARSNIDVSMVDIVKEHVEISRSKGITIEGPVDEFTHVVKSFLPDEVIGKYDCIILAVKAQATEMAVRSILPHLSDQGFILSAQNGLNERIIADIAGENKTMGAFVNFGADWIEPGKILFGNRGAVVVGEIDKSIRNRTKKTHELLKIFEPNAIITKDIWAYLWGKMGYGAMLFATALTPDSMAMNFSDPSRGPVLIGLATEVMKTALAEGINPKPFNGFNPLSFMPNASLFDSKKCLSDLAEFNSKTAKTHTGIYRDLAVRKRKTEVDPQLGVIVEIANQHNIETPLLKRLIQLINDIEEDRREMSIDTFNELSRLIS